MQREYSPEPRVLKHESIMRLAPKSVPHADTISIEHIDSLYGYALALSRNQSDAEDLVQETYVRAIPATKRLKPESNIKSWLFTILRNVWLNQLRQRRIAPEFVHVDIDQTTGDRNTNVSNDPHALYVRRVERVELLEAIQQLPVDFREVILLREFEELSYQEIADLVACPLGTVMSRLARARSRLRTLLLERFKPETESCE
jgi:RNA polymerase sigma-70 factor (ECF subfamily)